MSDLFPDKEKKKANRSKGSTITIRTTKKTADAFQELKIKTGLTYEQLIEKIITEGFGNIVRVNSIALKETYANFEKKVSEPYNNLNQIAKHCNSGGMLTNEQWNTFENLEKTMLQLLGYLRNQKNAISIEKRTNSQE